jgi:hypothetical protein
MGTLTPPASSYNAVYHPIKYTFAHNSALAIETLRVELVVTVNGTAHNYTYRVGYNTKSGNDYTFIFDVSQFVKQHLPPFSSQVSSAFRFSSTSYTVTNPEFLADIDVECFPEYRNAAGALVDDNGDDAANDLKALPASYRRTDTKNLNLYTSGTTTKAFLTKRPSGSTYCVNSETSLTFHCDYSSLVVLRVNLYNAAGSNIYEYPHNLTTVIGINTIPLTLATYLAAYPTAVRAVVAIYWNGANRISENYTMLLDNNCCTGYTFSWLNELGGVDNYTFCGENEVQMSVDSSFASQYDDGVTTRLKGNYKTQSVIGEVLQVRDLLSTTDIDWIKYILASHEVYVKIGASWYNCVILDSSAITESNINGMFEFNFTARLSDIVTNHN